MGDLEQPGVLPDGAFDYIILTEVLQYVFDLRTAAAALYRALGGVLLVTVPGSNKSEQHQWPLYWGAHNIVYVGSSHGNVFVATAFLFGIASEELDVSNLNTEAADLAIIVAARIVKWKDT